MSTAPVRQQIRYDPATHDFACLLDGALIGRAPSYREAEALLERHLLDEQRREVAAQPQKLALTAREAAAALSLPISTFYGHVNAGRIPVIRLGAQIRVPVAALQKLVEELAETPAPELVATDPDILAIRPYNRRKAT